MNEHMNKVVTAFQKLRTKRGNGPRVYGKPGASARRQSTSNKPARVPFRDRVPLNKTLLAGTILAVFSGAVWSASGLGKFTLATATVLGIWFLFELLIRKPQVFVSILIYGVYVYGLISLAPFYAAVTSPAGMDVAGAFFVLAVLGILVMLVAHRWSLGSKPLTVAFALAAVTFVGPFIIALYPPLGYVAAYVAAGAVLFWRCGGSVAAWDALETVMSQWQNRKATIPTPNAEDSWAKGARGEELTADLLTSLDAEWTIMHDLAVPGTDANIDHVVIGPGGVFVLDSKNYSGRIDEDPHRGLVIGNRPLAPVLYTALWEAREAARVLRLDDDKVATIVVVHTARMAKPRYRVAVYDDNRDRVGDVTVVSADALLAELDTGIGVMERKMYRRLVKRAQVMFRDATDPSRKADVRQGGSALPYAESPGAALLTEDGQPTREAGYVPADSEYVDPDVLLVGPNTVVKIVQDGGQWDNYVVVSEQCHQAGFGDTLGVWACPRKEWTAAWRENRRPSAKWYPLSWLQIDTEAKPLL